MVDYLLDTVLLDQFLLGWMRPVIPIFPRCFVDYIVVLGFSSTQRSCFSLMDTFFDSILQKVEISTVGADDAVQATPSW